MDELIRTVVSLRNMISEMDRKGLELKRITKTSALLMMSGLSSNSIPINIVERCIREQNNDGGWVGVLDTIWNTQFLKLLSRPEFHLNIEKALNYLETQKNPEGLWGRSIRDISRIPVSALFFYLFPRMTNNIELTLLEELWEKEKGSLTYKAGYTLMAFSHNDYIPKASGLIEEAVYWLLNQQNEDGGFSPWKEHPVDSDVFCTSIASLGLACYSDHVPSDVFIKARKWLLDNRLKSGIWKYHEIEDGASWGLYTLSQLRKII